MLVLLKDVEPDEIEAVFETAFSAPLCDENIVRDTIFGLNRRSQFRYLRTSRPDTIVLCIYRIGYLRWALLFEAMVWASARRAFVLDTTGRCLRLSFWTICWHTLVACGASTAQLFALLTYNRLVRTLKQTTVHVRDGWVRDGPKVAYLRTTETFNLKSGGALGHTIGVISAFSKLGPIRYFGMDRMRHVPSEITRVVEPETASSLLCLFRAFPYSISFERAIRAEVASAGTNLIYQRYSRDNISGLLLRQHLRVPLVLEFNGFMGWETGSSPGRAQRLFMKATNKIEMANLMLADLIVTVSRPLLEDLVAIGVPVEKIALVPNAVDPVRFDYNSIAGKTVRGQLGIPNTATVVGFSGTFGFWHGVDVLESAIAQFDDSICHFLLIGDGSLRQPMIERLGPRPNVTFAGTVPYDDVPSFLSACDILVSPTHVPDDKHFIGSPTKLFEYMAMGKIIITSNVDQPGEVISPAITIDDNGTHFDPAAVGITVPPGDATALASAVKYAVANLSELAQVATNARVRAVQSHNWDGAVSKILERLAQVSPTHSSGASH